MYSTAPCRVVQLHVEYIDYLLFSMQVTFKFANLLGLTVLMQAMLIYYIILCV